MQVLETAQQVGRFSISTRPDVTYREMANQCEALLTGKQQKMSTFMGVQQKPEISVSVFFATSQLFKCAILSCRSGFLYGS